MLATFTTTGHYCPLPTSLCDPVPLVNQFFSVAAGAATNIPIPLSLMMSPVGASDVVETNGINVIASQPVSVYALDYDQYASAAFTGYPTTLLGTNYCLMARPAWASGDQSQFAILATESNTTVWITPSPTADLVGYPGTNTYQTNLQAGAIYQNRNLYTVDEDVTGTWISSDKPVVVFAGANQAFVPDETTLSGNPLVQEQLPVESWGKEVLALSFAGRTNGDSYRVLAAYDDTVITITGKVVTVVDENAPYGPWSVTTSNEVVLVTNQAGQFYDIIVDGLVEFQASQPIQVAQFANGVLADHVYDSPFDGEGDPCEILLPPAGHYMETNTVVTLTNDYTTGDFNENYLNVILVQSAITSTLVDGMPLAATNFVAIGSSGYYGSQIVVTNSGAHTVTSSMPVGVQIYGWGVADAYGYFGGIVK